MKTAWKVVEVGAWIGFVAFLALDWLSTFRDVGVGYEGSLAVPVCVVLIAIANRKRGGSLGDPF